MASEIEQPGLLPPLAPRAFLEWMDSDLPGLYLLGSLNRHITVHSQQCRAINLVQALMKEVGLDGKSIAIVGAGFAGLTAAAFTLEKTTAQVALFDAAPRPLWLQDGCINRWLHPGIYDWPSPGSLEPCTALPVLNWRAGTARNVASQIRSQWERFAATQGRRLHLRMETRIKEVTSTGGQLSVTLSNNERVAFDIIVLAVGFGLEHGEHGRVAYWNDADGLDGIAKGSSVLVAGFGDGGLADVLRLCMPDIRQDSLIELVRHVPADIQERLLEKENSYRGNGAALDDFYSDLRVQPVIDRIVNAAPPLARVTLAGTGNPYGPRSAILNRFLVSQLHRSRDEEAFELLKEAVNSGSLYDLPGGRRRIKIGEEEREFDHVVLRLGPDPAYKQVSPLSNSPIAVERRRHWRDMPQSLDPTRVLLKELGEAHGTREEWRQDFLAYESSSRRWCLVLHPPDPDPALSVRWDVHTKHALENVGPDIDDLNVEPLMLCSKDAVADQREIRRAVRALCAADIVIADVTDYDPGLLLLLGIRAAVRRGVTIACTKKALGPEDWKELPFNLKELNPISFYNEVEGQKQLREALRAGLMQSGVSTRYLDLPVYDYIREESTDKAAPDDRRVLLLRAFKGYEGARKIHVEERIRQGLGLPEASVKSAIDQTSPRLAGQRLYEAIRYWKTCVVDLTWWRPNVMFELGVRLAVRPTGTYCLIDKSVEAGTASEPESVRDRLKRLLNPFSYTFSTASFSKAFDRRDSGPNPVFETAARHFRTAQDHPHEQVDAMLLAAADVMRDSNDPLQAVDFKALYADENRTYSEEIRHSAFERLCAAWSYLVDREEPHLLRPLDLLDERRAVVFRRFCALGSRLKNMHRYEPRDERLRQRIESTLHQARESKTTEMLELLDAWRNIRDDAPWKTDVAELHEDDLQYYIQKLDELEARLQELASPVCELPLQGVGSDRRRVEIVLEALRRRVS